MKMNVFPVLVFASVLLMGSLDCHAESWVKNEVDIPSKNVEANFYNSDSVKAHDGTLSWTEKTVLTDFGAKYYTKHLSKYPVCQKNIAKKGDATYHQIDLEIKNGKYRTVAKRNYSKTGELLCTDKDMGTEFDMLWKVIPYASPMYWRENHLVTKYKLGNL